MDEIVELKREELQKFNKEDSIDAAEEQMDPEELAARDLEEFVKQWEKEFDFVNANPEENSDFDSDNEINPIDTLDSLGRYINSASK